jgi:hypothetical protein
MKPERYFEGTPVKLPDWLGQTEPVTRQTIFDCVVRLHRAQRSRCPPEGDCFYYFGPLRCFISPVLGEYFDPAMEGIPVPLLPKAFALPQWFNVNINFIAELQETHDTETNWPSDRMDTVLELFAEERGLTMPA